MIDLKSNNTKFNPETFFLKMIKINKNAIMSKFAMTEANKLIENDSKKYTNLSIAFNDIEKVVSEKYEELMKGDKDMIPFKTWWTDFCKLQINKEETRKKKASK